MSLLNTVFVIAMTAAGCSSGNPVSPPDSTSPPVETGDRSSTQATTAEIGLQFDEVLEYQGLKLRWLELEDSRCPIGVACIWEGQIVATIEVTRGDESPVELQLLLRAGLKHEAKRAFDYDLLLLAVDPHPKEGVTAERNSYLARVEITGP